MDLASRGSHRIKRRISLSVVQENRYSHLREIARILKNVFLLFLFVCLFVLMLS